MADREIMRQETPSGRPNTNLPPLPSDLVDALHHPVEKIIPQDGDDGLPDASRTPCAEASEVRPQPVPPHQKRRGCRAGDQVIREEKAASPINQMGRQYPFLVGTSEPMMKVLYEIAAAAWTDKNVCVYGESGTGKELVARAIHYSSGRSNRPLIAYDCSTLPEGLVEAELFGHVKGSFSSAVDDREGVFHLANGGSLFFDEIGELSLAFQEKLLRVLQCREFRNAGGRDPIKVDLRIIASSNRDLSELVDIGRFRQDLFSRLEKISITLPALREHKEDIPVLVDYFVQRFNRQNEKQIQGVSAKTMGLLLRYDWPGNVRELENCIWRAAAMSEADTLDVEDLSQLLRLERRRPNPISPENNSWPRDLKEAEQDVIVKSLRYLNGNRAQTARFLGISLRSLYYKLKGIEEARIPPARRKRIRMKQTSPSCSHESV